MSDEVNEREEFRFFDLWERGRGWRAASRHQLPWIEARSERMPPLFGSSIHPSAVTPARPQPGS